MKVTAKIIAYGILVVVAAVFAVKTFLYGGSTFEDPNDSPLYKSTLDRAVANFKESDYVLSRDGAPGKNSPYGTQGTAAHPQHGQPAQGDMGAQYHQAGVQFFQQGKFTEAVTYLEAAAQVAPNNPMTHTYLGMAYDKLGDKEKSRLAYQKAASLTKPQQGSQSPKVSQPPAGTAPQPSAQQPTASQYLQAGMAQYRDGKFKEAVPYFEAATKADPQDHTAYSMLGNCYFALRDNAKMIEAYEAATKAMPTDAESHYNLGIARAQLGDAQEARLAFQKAIQLDPKHTHAHAGLGKLLQDQGKPEEAMKEFQYEIDYCKDLIKQKPDEAPTHNRLAHFYLQYNINVEEGLKLADTAVTLKPEEPSYLATAAQLNFRAGNKDKAIELIDKALQKAPDSLYFQAIKKNFTAPPKTPKPDTAPAAKPETPTEQSAPPKDAPEKTVKQDSPPDSNK